MIEEKSWKDLQDAGLLWWINRGLHLFGWSIVFQEESDGSISKVYPAKVSFRGFDSDLEKENFRKLSKYMKDNAEEIHSHTI